MTLAELELRATPQLPFFKNRPLGRQLLHIFIHILRKRASSGRALQVSDNEPASRLYQVVDEMLERVEQQKL
jgi:ribosomal protein S18 acetylase RimI-like enzyme